MRGRGRTDRGSLGDRCGLLELVQGDAADIQLCQELRQHNLKEYSGLGFLVCNASPPIRPLLLCRRT